MWKKRKKAWYKDELKYEEWRWNKKEEENEEACHMCVISSKEKMKNKKEMTIRQTSVSYYPTAIFSSLSHSTIL